jgi:hypothetical protein
LGCVESVGRTLSRRADATTNHSRHSRHFVLTLRHIFFFQFILERRKNKNFVVKFEKKILAPIF